MVPLFHAVVMFYCNRMNNENGPETKIIVNPSSIGLFKHIDHLSKPMLSIMYITQSSSTNQTMHIAKAYIFPKQNNLYFIDRYINGWCWIGNPPLMSISSPLPLISTLGLVILYLGMGSSLSTGSYFGTSRNT